jgi:aspartate carbamoyltransferase catalytic subunit
MKSKYKGIDVISAADISRDFIEFIIEKTDALRNMDPEKKASLLRGKTMASLFFEPSTRTRDSFSMAIQSLGGRVIGFDSAKASSSEKGETIWDTVKMYEGYGADLIVMRHPRGGAARLAAEGLNIPIINAGDGQNQHPTQMLLDLYSIKKSQGRIDGLNIALAGDLRYGRTVHSLFQALQHYKVKIFLVSPPTLKMPDYIKDQGRSFTEHDKLEEIVKKADVIYMTRLQRERFPDENEYMKVRGSYRLTMDMLTGAKKNLKILHPLPKVDEIENSIDSSKYAYYIQQATNGLFVRQSLICMLLGVEL